MRIQVAVLLVLLIPACKAPNLFVKGIQQEYDERWDENGEKKISDMLAKWSHGEQGQRAIGRAVHSTLSARTAQWKEKIKWTGAVAGMIVSIVTGILGMLGIHISHAKKEKLTKGIEGLVKKLVEENGNAR